VSRSAWLATAVLALLLSVVLGAASLGRSEPNYGAETDFLGSFVPEAQRLQRGEAPRLEFHPPLYPAALALAWHSTGDWLRAGLLLSALGALLALVSGVWLLARLAGPAAALGAGLGVCLSDTFVSYAQQATSDVFFTALLLLGLALLFEPSASPGLKLASGLALGLAALTRSNGVTALAFGAGLLWGSGGWSGRARRIAPWLAGFSVPLLAWALVASQSGAPLLPRQTHANLALTYLAEGDRTSGDALAEASAGIEGSADVLRRAGPGRAARVYLRDFAGAVRNVFTQDLLVFPAAQLALPGLLLLLVRMVEHRRFGVLAGLAASFLVLNLKAWESRYHLYLVPFLGAGVGLLVERALAAARSAGRARLLAAAGGVALVLAAGEMWRVQDEQGGGLSHDARAAAAVLAHYGPGPGARVVARKPHLCYHAALACEAFPDVSDEAALGLALARISAASPEGAELFLFYGYAEKLLRPGLWRLGRRDYEVAWLTRIGLGKETGKWALYRVRREALPAPAFSSPSH
jgi:hypothetical protein